MKKYSLLFLAGCSIVLSNCGPARQTHQPQQPAAPAPPAVENPKPAPPQPAPPSNTESMSANTLSAAEKAAGWKLLFDGVSTDGWHAYGSKAIGAAWKAEGGAMHLDASSKKEWQTESGGDIVSDDEYGDFELQLDWKISKDGNSGVCIYVNEDKSKYKYMWETGMECQVLDNDGNHDGQIHKHRAGDLYDLIASSSEPVKAVGEWNHLVIRSVNSKLDFFLNGVNVVSTTLWNDNWSNLIANSKFKSMPGFGTFHKGHIGLQDHGHDVWFRNIKIRKL